MPVYSSRPSESPAAVMEPVAKVPTAMELWRRQLHTLTRDGFKKLLSPQELWEDTTADRDFPIPILPDNPSKQIQYYVHLSAYFSRESNLPLDHISKIQLWLQMGDKAFNLIPYDSILPVAGLTPLQSYKYLTLPTPIPTMSYNREQAALYKRLLSTPKSGNPQKDIQGYHLLQKQTIPRICQSIMQSRPINQLRCIHITMNFPPHMDIPETWSRGMYLSQRMPNHLNSFLRNNNCDPIIITMGLESHRGGRARKKKKGKGTTLDDEDEQDPNAEDLTLTPSMHLVADGDTTLRRKTLQGHCHIHACVLYLEPPNVEILDHDLTSACKLSMVPDIKITRAQWGQGKQVKDKKTKGTHSVDDVSTQVVYPLKECQLNINRECCYWFGSPDNLCTHRMVICKQEALIAAVTVRATGMNVQCILLPMPGILPRHITELNKLQRTTHCPTLIALIGAGCDERHVTGTKSAPSRNERLIKASVEQSKKMKSNGNKYGSPTKALQHLRTLAYDGAWDANSHRIATEARLVLAQEF